MTEYYPETINFQSNKVPLYQSQDHDISFFDDFSLFPFEKFDNLIPKDQKKDNEDNLIELRKKKDEIIDNLKLAQEELKKASGIYPSRLWSNYQTQRIKQLNASIMRESKILKANNESINQYKTDAYKNNIKNSDDIINKINQLFTSNLPYIFESPNDNV